MPKIELSLSEIFSNLRNSSTRLNQVTDEMADLVRNVENFLNVECSIGLYEQVTVEKIKDEYDTIITQTLEYRRIGERFRICVVWYESDDEDSEYPNIKPWSDCSRDEKIKTIKKLPILLAELSKKVITVIQEAETATQNMTNEFNLLFDKEI